MASTKWALAAGSVLAGIVPAVMAPAASAADYLVRDMPGYEAAMRKVQPGDSIVLVDGTWRDAQLLFQADGTSTHPITLTAQTKGKVVLSGASSLKLAGRYLVVSGLVFRDGHAPGEEVISFRRDSRNVAVHSRLTEVVIDHYNQPDRRKEDRWVSLYGQDNRVDHSWFAGKGNAGVTLAVIRPKGQPEANRHRIDHNYFGPRPPLGSNGGETIRIGTSDESLSDSATLLESNMFDRCDGEVEIVSIKSGANVVRGNLVYQSQGAIVLRHGDGNLVERNVFIGGGKAHTGGVRVINRRQVVRGNYMERLAGTDFTSALAVMNGVPGSTINRYHPVSEAEITHNSMFAIARVTLGAGADAERTAPPTGSSLRGNLFTAADPGPLFQVEADTKGIAATDNVADRPAPAGLAAGIRHAPIALRRAENGLLYPVDPALAKLGAPRDLAPLRPEDVGPAWYAKPAGTKAFPAGRTLSVSPAGLVQAMAQAQSGDVLRLAPGHYELASTQHIAVPLTLSGPAEAEISFSAPTLFTLDEGGRLRLEGLTIRGGRAPRQPGNAVVRSSAASTVANYTVELDGTRFAEMDAAPDFNLIATTAGTFADRIVLRNVAVSGLSGTVLAAAAETGGKGYYAAEHIEIDGSRFDRIGSLADILRGGTDESTFGPEFTLRNSRITGSGPVLLTLSGVQSTRIENNDLIRSGEVRVAHSVGAPDTRILGNRFDATPEPKITRLYPQGTPSVQISGNTRSGETS